MVTTLANEPDVEIGSATLRPSTCELVSSGRVDTLEPRVMQVLVVLARHAGRVVSRDALVERCWSGRSVSEDAINRVMSRIRRVGEETGAFGVTTIRSVGYRIDAAEITSAAQTVRDAHRFSLRRWLYIAAVVAVLLIGLGIAYFVAPANPPEQPGSQPVIRSISVSAHGTAQGAQSAVASRLRTTLSQMRGLRVIDAGGVAGPPDLALDSVVTSMPGGATIALALNDRSGARVWGATFEPFAASGVAVEDRAVSSAARYLAVWLGDRVTGEPAAREPDNPEVTQLVSHASLLLEQASRARHNRDWPLFARLTGQAEQLGNRVFALDPRSGAVAMLRYEMDVDPQYPRPGETLAAFRERGKRAGALIAQALAADPDEPRVLVAAAEQYRRALRWKEARALLRRAVAIDPNSADANTWYAYDLGLFGHCKAGLQHARIAAALEPEQIWRQLAVPRLLHCAGRRKDAADDYVRVLRRDPGNVFVLREFYLMLLAQQHASNLRALADTVKLQLWRGKPAPPVVTMLVRIRAAADALDGRRGAFLGILDTDREQFRRLPLGHNGFGRTRGDAAFVLAVEYAFGGATDRSIVALRDAVEEGSLYLPWALPYGASPLPSEVRKDPRYAALWQSSPAIAQLIDERRRASRTR
jgi:DNA-binding winged helix-turn-helix (wHTH) protein/tetratricopeptide (TPR) repeat protein